jgi:hypothetical protein
LLLSKKKERDSKSRANQNYQDTTTKQQQQQSSEGSLMLLTAILSPSTAPANSLLSTHLYSTPFFTFLSIYLLFISYPTFFPSSFPSKPFLHTYSFLHYKYKSVSIEDHALVPFGFPFCPNLPSAPPPLFYHAKDWDFLLDSALRDQKWRLATMRPTVSWLKRYVVKITGQQL